MTSPKPRLWANPLVRTAALRRRKPLKPSPVPMLRVPIKPVSAKRAKVNRERTKTLKQLADNAGGRPLCVAPFGPPHWADDAHEIRTRARGGSITNPENIAPLCRVHHREITDTEPAWAYEAGLLKHSWESQ